MADFSWLDAVDRDDWQPRSNGWCLKEMTWPEFAARCRHESANRELLDSFRLWSDKHRNHQYALTWDLPVTGLSSVYVCREGALAHRPVTGYQAALRSARE
ncbi:MAG: hypothetical protein ABWX88_02105 [Pseudoxanthomonas sp.]